MGSLRDMRGFRSGRLNVIERAGAGAAGQALWRCYCDCGGETLVSGSHLRDGHTRSCGCLLLDKNRELRLRHGHARASGHSRTYRSWASMLTRCTNENAWQFKYYGGRGISVCDRWRSFDAFLADMGERPPETTLDRIDTDGDYEPENCRWATPEEQSRNRRPRAKAAV